MAASMAWLLMSPARLVPLHPCRPLRASGRSRDRAAASVRVRDKILSREEFLARPIDEEWEAARRRESEELERRREDEDAEEVRKALDYRRMGECLQNYPAGEIIKAKRLVAKLILSGQDVEKLIVEAADKRQLTPLVRLIIKTRLDIARYDDERDAIEAFDLLQRRIEYEVMSREASPALRFLNHLLHLRDGTDDGEWLRKCRHAMLDTFPPEVPFTLLKPPGFNLSKHAGPIDAPPEADDILLRIDFIREIDQLITEVQELFQPETIIGMDADAVSLRLKQEEKKRTLQHVKDVLDVAIKLKW